MVGRWIRESTGLTLFAVLAACGSGDGTGDTPADTEGDLGTSESAFGGERAVYGDFPGAYYKDPNRTMPIRITRCDRDPRRRVQWGNNTALGHKYWFDQWCGYWEGVVPYIADNIVTVCGGIPHHLRAITFPIVITSCPADPWRQRPWGANTGEGHHYWFRQWCGPAWKGTYTEVYDGTPIVAYTGGEYAGFYAKQIDVGGLRVQASHAVPTAALRAARATMLSMVGTNVQFLRGLSAANVSGTIMAREPLEYTLSIPEQRGLDIAFPLPGQSWNQRARGLGANAFVPRDPYAQRANPWSYRGGYERPVFSGAEESLLHQANDRYAGEDIFLHEFSHVALAEALTGAIPGLGAPFRARVTGAYQRAMSRGLWKNTYAASNADEYWAEGVQSYFSLNARPDFQHNSVNSASSLASYDSELHGLIREVFKGDPWACAP